MSTKFRDTQSFTPLQMEAALCAWEWMTENREHEKIAPHFAGLGYAGMRQVSIQAGDIACRTYDLMREKGYEYAGSYDWEFIPAVLLRLDWSKLTADNQFNDEPYEPNIEDIFVAMITADLAGTTVPDHRLFQKGVTRPDAYLLACKVEAIKQWAYADLVSDHEETFERYHEENVTAAEAVRLVGEKYDLTPATTW